MNLLCDLPIIKKSKEKKPHWWCPYWCRFELQEPRWIEISEKKNKSAEKLFALFEKCAHGYERLVAWTSDKGEKLK